MNDELPAIQDLPEKAGQLAHQAGETAQLAKEAAGELLHTARNKTQEAAHLARERAAEAFDLARNRTHEAVRAAREKGGQALAQGSQVVRENPVPALLGALAVGICVGVLISRREERLSFRERFAADPLHTTREALLAALAPVAGKLHEQYDAARSSAVDTVNRINSRQNRRALDHLFSQARRTADNLKFW